MSLKYTNKPSNKIRVKGLFLHHYFPVSSDQKNVGSSVFLISDDKGFEAESIIYFYQKETPINKAELSLQEQYFIDILAFASAHKLSSIAIPFMPSEDTARYETKLEILSKLILEWFEKEPLKVTIILPKETPLRMRSRPKMTRIIHYIDRFFEENHPPLQNMFYSAESRIEPLYREQRIIQKKDISPWLSDTEKTFAELMIDWMNKKDIKNQDLWKKANIDRRLFSKILSGGHPSKKTAILLSLGLELELDDALDLLSRAGYTLSHSIKEDLVVEWHIKNKVFSVFEVCAIQCQLGLSSLF